MPNPPMLCIIGFGAPNSPISAFGFDIPPAPTPKPPMPVDIASGFTPGPKGPACAAPACTPGKPAPADHRKPGSPGAPKGLSADGASPMPGDISRRLTRH